MKMINQMPNSNAVELTRFGAMQIIMNIEVGLKAFGGIEKSMRKYSKSSFTEPVDVQMCFNACKKAFFDMGKHGLEQLIDEKLHIEDSEIIPLSFVNHRVPDSWVVLEAPLNSNNNKLYKVFVNWYAVDKYELSPSIASLNDIEEFPNYYLWRSSSRYTYLLPKLASGRLTPSAEQEFYLYHVNKTYLDLGDANFYKPKLFKNLLSKHYKTPENN
mgnify:CR=1 FL=1